MGPWIHLTAAWPTACTVCGSAGLPDGSGMRAGQPGSAGLLVSAQPPWTQLSSCAPARPGAVLGTRSQSLGWYTDTPEPAASAAWGDRVRGLLVSPAMLLSHPAQEDPVQTLVPEESQRPESGCPAEILMGWKIPSRGAPGSAMMLDFSRRLGSARLTASCLPLMSPT